MVDRTVEEDGVVEEVTEGIAIAVQGHFRQSHLSLHLLGDFPQTLSKEIWITFLQIYRLVFLAIKDKKRP